MRTILATPALAVLLTLVLSTTTAHAALEVGDAAPDWTLPTVDGESEITLSELRGKHVLLDFWATWCGPCRTAMTNELAPLWNGAGDRSDDWTMISIGVPSNNTAEQQQEYAAANNYGWHFVYDGDRVASEAYEVRFIPTLVLVDPSGTITHLGHDAVTAMAAELEFDLAAAQAEAAAAAQAAENEANAEALQGATALDQDTAEGDVAIGGTVAYRYTFEEGGAYRISVTSDEFDTTLTIFDSEFRQIGFNDDDPTLSGTNSAVEFSDLEAGVELYLMVGSYNNSGGGAFVLAIEKMVDPITETHDGEVTNAGPFSVTYQVPDAGRLFVTAVSDDIDPVLSLESAGGDYLGDNDDYPGMGRNSGIVIFVEAGDEIVASVRAYDNQSEGAVSVTFELTVGAEAPDNVPMIPLTPGGVDLDDAIDMEGAQLDGSLADGDATALYRIISPGPQSTITVVSAEFDTVLTIYDTNGDVVASNDDYGDGTNSQVVLNNYQDDVYYAHIRAFAGANGGAFTITVEAGEAMTEPDNGDTPWDMLGEAEYFDQLSGTFTLADDQQRVFYAPIPAEGPARVIVESEDFDTMLVVYNEDGQLIGENDDADGTNTTNSRVDADFVANGEGLYIVVRSFTGNGGSFTLTIQSDALEQQQQERRNAILARIAEGTPALEDGATTVDSEDFVIVRLQSTKDSGVEVSLRTQAYLGVTMVVDENGNELPVELEMDWSGEMPTYNVEVPRLPAETKLFIVLMSESFTRGYAEPFQVMFSTTYGEPVFQAENAQSLEGSAEAELTGAGAQVFAYTATEAGSLSLRATSDSDPVIEVLNEYGMVVAMNDDESADSFNAAVRVAVEAGQTIYIRVFDRAAIDSTITVTAE